MGSKLLSDPSNNNVPSILPNSSGKKTQIGRIPDVENSGRSFAKPKTSYTISLKICNNNNESLRSVA
jgi:hypothetical protein